MHQQQTWRRFFLKKERLYSFGDRLAAGTQSTQISSSTYLIRVQSLLNVNGHKVGSLSLIGPKGKWNRYFSNMDATVG
jgi:hypothetical protein